MYLSIKLIHIFSAVILYGTGLGSAFYLWMAYRKKEAVVFRNVVNWVVLADAWFTTPAIVIQFLTGWYLLSQLGVAWNSLWFVQVAILSLWMLLCWLPVVWIQLRMRTIMQDVKIIPKSVDSLMRAWFWLGVGAFMVGPFIFYLMVFKPGMGVLL